MPLSGPSAASRSALHRAKDLGVCVWVLFLCGRLFPRVEQVLRFSSAWIVLEDISSPFSST